MNPLDESRLFELVSSFRAAILRTEKSKLPISLSEFPVGSCGDASLLLARFLQEHGLGEASYVCGHLGPYSHAWLEVGEFQIDITADQFVSDPEKELWSGRPGDLWEGVMVTHDRSWHSKFEEQIRHSADLSLYDASSRAELEHYYREITGNL